MFNDKRKFKQALFFLLFLQLLIWKDVPNATSYNIYWSDKPEVTKKNGTKISNVKNPHKLKGLKRGGNIILL